MLVMCFHDAVNVLFMSSQHAVGSIQSRSQSQGAGAEIANIAWNRKVQHILASCTVGGSVTVWDLKKQQPVLNIRDSSGYAALHAATFVQDLQCC